MTLIKLDVRPKIDVRIDVKKLFSKMFKMQNKHQKNAIFRKSAEKVLEKWGGGPILIDYFES